MIKDKSKDWICPKNMTWPHKDLIKFQAHESHTGNASHLLPLTQAWLTLLTQ